MASILFGACKYKPCDPGQAPPRFAGPGQRSESETSFALRATWLAKDEVKDAMKKRCNELGGE
jgi:hypothetical protein